MKDLRLIALALLIAAIPTGVRAQQAEAPAFGGYDSVAMGAAVSAFPSASGQVVENPAEATFSLSVATLGTGGQGFARASTFYPGDLIARFEAIAKFFGPAPDLPDYPVVAEARHFDEPQDASVPGATMRAEADPSSARAVAESRFGSEELSVGSASSVSTSAFEGDSITAHTVTTVSNVVLGVVTIDQVRTTSTSVTDGSTATCTGDVEVTGLTVAGNKASISRAGVHADGEPVVPGGDPDQQIRDALAAAGVDLRVIGAQPGCGSEGVASHSASGLLVSMPVPEAGAVEARLNLVLGQAATSVATTGAAVVDLGSSVPSDVGAGEPTPPATQGSSTDAPAPTGGGSGGPTAQAAGPAPVRSGGDSSDASGFVPALQTEPVAYDFDGVPATLVLGLLIGSIPVVRMLRRYMDRLLMIGSSA